MEKEFITYEQAVSLKELEFDETCISGYSTTTKRKYFYSRPTATQDSFTVDRPTYSQAFRWFRDKHTLFAPVTDNGLGQYDFRIGTEWCGQVYETYEEAESACLDKLIEITKNK